MGDAKTPVDSEEAASWELQARPRPPTPRWVLVLGLIAVALVVAFLVSRLAGVEHGPGLHGSMGEDPLVAVLARLPF